MTRIRVADLRSDCPSGRGVDVDGVETELWEVKTINKGGIELAVRQGFVPGRGEPRGAPLPETVASRQLSEAKLAVRQGFVPGRGEPREPRRCLKPWRADT